MLSSTFLFSLSSTPLNIDLRLDCPGLKLIFESESESDNNSTTVRVLPPVQLLYPTEKFDSSEDSLLLEDELFDDDDERGTWVVAW